MDQASEAATPSKLAKFGKFLGDILEPIAKEFGLGFERGLAIAHLATLEEVIRRAIQAKMIVIDKNLAELIGGGDTGGSLGFSDQCRLAFCLGMFGPETLNDLKMLGRIRNRFAHGEKGIDFDDAKIRPLCEKLKTCDRFIQIPDWRHLLIHHKLSSQINGPRDRYFATIIFIATALERDVMSKSPIPCEGPILLI